MDKLSCIILRYQEKRRTTLLFKIAFILVYLISTS